VAQADVLGQMLTAEEQRLDHVLSLRVPAEEIVQRLAGRRTCRKCGAMYHQRFEKPARPGLCDRCGGELFQRDDDREDTVRARLQVYQRETAPLEEYYQARSLLRPVDGTGSAAAVRARVLALLNGAS
jgi:adenylate kinase